MTKRGPAGGAAKKYHPPSEKLPPRAYKPIRDDAPARELGEFLRAMVRDSGISLDTIARRGGIAKNTFTTTMDGRSKPWTSINAWLTAFTHPEVKGTCTDEQREEIERLYRIGQETKQRQDAEAKAARKPVEKAPARRSEAPSTADPRPETPIQQYQPRQLVTIDVEMPRRIPGARIDPQRRAFLDEADAAARLETQRVFRLHRAQQNLVVRGVLKGQPVKAVVPIANLTTTTGSAQPMPSRCVLNSAEIAKHVGRPTTHLHSSWSREYAILSVFPSKPSEFFAVRAPGLPSPLVRREINTTDEYDVEGATVEIQRFLDGTRPAEADQTGAENETTVGPAPPALRIRRAWPARPMSALPPTLPRKPRGADLRRRMTTGPWTRSWSAVRARARLTHYRWARRRLRQSWTSEPPTTVAVIIIVMVVLVIGGSIYILTAHFWPGVLPLPQ